MQVTPATKRGGRKAGTLNRATVQAQAAAAAAGAGGGGRAGEGLVTSRARARGSEPGNLPRIRMVRPSYLIPYGGNPRTHSPAQVNKLAAAIEEFGFTNPILTDGKRRVLAGHGRLLAALQLGLYSVPTIPLSHLTAAQRRAYVIADNQLALSAGWDEGLLRVELGELRDAGFDLGLTGFDTRTLNGLLERVTADAPEPREKVTVTQEVACPSCGHAFRV